MPLGIDMFRSAEWRAMALTLMYRAMWSQAANHLALAVVGMAYPAPWLNASQLAKRSYKASRIGYKRFVAGTWSNGPLGRVEEVHEPVPLLEARIDAIAFFSGHDGSVAVLAQGRVQCILELERLFGKRYYSLPGQTFREEWLKALHVVRNKCECEDGACPHNFEYGVIVPAGEMTFEPSAYTRLPLVVEEVFAVKKWRTVNHHEAHALLGFHASPFRSALIVSYDGGGNDGAFNAYIGVGLQVHRVAQLDYNIGEAYVFMAGILSEVSGRRKDKLCSAFRANVTDLQSEAAPQLFNIHGLLEDIGFEKALGLAGKQMGYAATGKPIPKLQAVMLPFFENRSSLSVGHWGQGVPHKILDTVCQSIEGERAVGAALQDAFEQIASGVVRKLIERTDAASKVEGIVLTGGCALNVLANQLISDTSGTLTSKRGRLRPLDVYVPPAPNDCGLTVGALWAVAPPLTRQPLQYLGFRLWDEEILSTEASRRGARSLSALGGVEYLADLLAGGPAWMRQRGHKGRKPIVAVVRGRQEFGPRALGHRSLLAVPDSDEIRERLNRLKFRQWYRPVAPMIADEDLETVFGRVVKSPYMTMAPVVQEATRERYPALAHLDGTARHQSVGKDDEPWVHALLVAVGKRIGAAVLINTSFNSRGKPIVNTVTECLRMLDELHELDYVLIEDWLFQARS